MHQVGEGVAVERDAVAHAAFTDDAVQQPEVSGVRIEENLSLYYVPTLRTDLLTVTPYDQSLYLELNQKHVWRLEPRLNV